MYLNNNDNVFSEFIYLNNDYNKKLKELIKCLYFIPHKYAYDIFERSVY